MISPDDLEDILKVLREHNVASFSCSEFAVNLLPAAPASEYSVADAIKDGNEASKAPVAHGVFGHPSLWPNGVPSRFPGTEGK